MVKEKESTYVGIASYHKQEPLTIRKYEIQVYKEQITIISQKVFIFSGV